MPDKTRRRMNSLPEFPESIRPFLAPDTADNVDLSTLELVPEEQLADVRDLAEVGLLWKMKTRKSRKPAYLLLQFPISVDPYMAFRTFVYTGLVHWSLVRRGEADPDDALPPILPLVIYSGKKRWNASSLAPLCEPDPNYALESSSEEGLETEIKRSLISVLHGTIAYRHGGETADRLDSTLRRLDDPVHIGSIANLALDCENGRELVTRVEEMLQPA